MNENRFEPMYCGRLSSDTEKQGTRTQSQSPKGQSSETLHRSAQRLASSSSRKSTFDSGSKPPTNVQAEECQGILGTVNTSTVVGTLLGLAAGAILTYGIVSSDKRQSSHHEADSPPGLQRDVKPKPDVPLGTIRISKEPESASRHQPRTANPIRCDLLHRRPSNRQLGEREFPVTRRLPSDQPSDVHIACAGPETPCDIARGGFPAVPRARPVGYQQIVQTDRGEGLKAVYDGTTAPVVNNHGSSRLSSSAQQSKGSLVPPSGVSRPTARLSPRAHLRERIAPFDAERETYISARSHMSSSSVDQTPRHGNSQLATVDPFVGALRMPPPVGHTSARRNPLSGTMINSK
ncbi:hypothetical protein ED733_007029 [Metarhizium rileyi]|uniref:Uncharacterized protein n=1 Tax=Metarhizium rileyi (strain RCEF 4871) TaxID=1649241 RepID=A0A5C6GL47_METRR|nr:hypothetical protein ED733_007029 [Metarhizium rileyi]